MQEATVEAILTSIAVSGDHHLRKLAQAIEERNKEALTNLTGTAYIYSSLLKGLARDFELPGEWPHRVDEFYNEFHYLRELAMTILRRGAGG